ncbi:MAG: hypothetical protein RLZ14_1982, partial [Actinomycetota bacterium]
QATVELALCLPVVCWFMLLLVQVGLVVRDRLAVDFAARAGARAAAASTSPSAAREAATAAVGLHPLQVDQTDDERSVTVVVTFVDHTDVPLVGALLPDIEVVGRATMPVEPPGPGR